MHTLQCCLFFMLELYRTCGYHIFLIVDVSTFFRDHTNPALFSHCQWFNHSDISKTKPSAITHIFFISGIPCDSSTFDYTMESINDISAQQCINRAQCLRFVTINRIDKQFDVSIVLGKQNTPESMYVSSLIALKSKPGCPRQNPTKESKTYRN